MPTKSSNSWGHGAGSSGNKYQTSPRIPLKLLCFQNEEQECKGLGRAVHHPSPQPLLPFPEGTWNPRAPPTGMALSIRARCEAGIPRARTGLTGNACAVCVTVRSPHTGSSASSPPRLDVNHRMSHSRCASPARHPNHAGSHMLCWWGAVHTFQRLTSPASSRVPCFPHPGRMP